MSRSEPDSPRPLGCRPERPGNRFRSLCPGRISYRAGLRLQETLLERRPAGREDVLLLLEHDPVITLGRRSSAGHILASPQTLAERGIETIQSSRGGDVTYHGPGQLVGYPIVDLTALGRDLHRYLRLLEELVIDILAGFGLHGERVAGRTGVWVGAEKIASIGVGVRRWVSWHGFALNVTTDPAAFGAIIPCGLHNVQMTSMSKRLGFPLEIADVQRQAIRSFARVFRAEYAGTYDAPL